MAAKALAENSKKQQKRKPRGAAFQKGQTGNPGGRPKKTEEERTLEQMCKDKTPEALATILSIMAEGENERNKLSAAQYVIDRGWGKAKQEIEHVGKDGAELSLSVTFVAPSGK